MIIRKVKVTEYEYQAPINYVAGATEPDIQFQLTDYEIPSGATGRVYVGRSDGTFEYTVATISGNTVTVAPTSSMFSVKGAGAIQVTLYVGNEVVKNFAVPVYVHADLADDSAAAGSDVTGVFRAAEEQALADFAEDAEAKAAEVIESIPADYTELTEEVSELNERFNAYFPEYRNRLYVVGEYVTYNGYLLQCIKGATFPQPAPLNPDYWRVVQIDSLDALNAALYEMVSLIADHYTGMGQSYAVGDYCIYNNRLYRCTDAIESAVVFDSSKWEQVGSITNDYSLTVVDGMLCVAYEE